MKEQEGVFYNSSIIKMDPMNDEDSQIILGYLITAMKCSTMATNKNSEKNQINMYSKQLPFFGGG